MAVNDYLDTEKDLKDHQYLTFLLGDQHYGIHIEFVREIIGFQSYTEVPDMPPYVKGIINLRGNMIPLMDLRLRFNDAFVPYHERTCVVISEIGGLLIGLVVDYLSDVVVMDEKAYCDHPIVGLDEGNAYIEKVGRINDQLVFLLSTEKLMAPQLGMALATGQQMHGF